MKYTLESDGSIRLQDRVVPVPRTISAEARAMLRVAGTMPVSDEPMWAERERVDAMMSALNEAALERYPADVKETEIGGVHCHLIRPANLAPENDHHVLINLHGGGFVLGAGSISEAIPIATLTRRTVIAVDYRLAPEHPYPAAVDDAVAVYADVLAEHDATDVALFGTSAGGFITGQTIMRLAGDGFDAPACAGVFTAGGALDDFGDSAAIFNFSGFGGAAVRPLDDADSEVRAYLRDVTDRTDPLVSPIYGDLSVFPPTLLVTGTRDLLLSATTLFHRALRRAGVDADLFAFEAMPHGFWYAFDLPETQEVLGIMAAFFDRHLSPRTARSRDGDDD
jgi:monoterpene epsilon-lactone hydrolase